MTDPKLEAHFFSDKIRKIRQKMNNLLHTQEFWDEMAYFCEPIQENDPEDIFSFNFTNPFSKKSRKFHWHRTSGEPPQLDEQDIDEVEAQEILNALEHIEESSKKKKKYHPKVGHYYSHSPLEFVDIFENAKEVVVNIEIPDNVGDDIEIHGSPHELVIRADPDYRLMIPLKPRVDPESAIATFKKGLIEIKFEKSAKKPKTKICLEAK